MIGEIREDEPPLAEDLPVEAIKARLLDAYERENPPKRVPSYHGSVAPV